MLNRSRYLTHKHREKMKTNGDKKDYGVRKEYKHQYRRVCLNQKLLEPPPSTSF